MALITVRRLAVFTQSHIVPPCLLHDGSWLLVTQNSFGCETARMDAQKRGQTRNKATTP